jgi:hypothetical protein
MNAGVSVVTRDGFCTSVTHTGIILKVLASMIVEAGEHANVSRDVAMRSDLVCAVTLT